MICVYRLTNNYNNIIYIGATKDYSRRIKEHKYNKRLNSKISRAINKFGFNNFKVEILEIVIDKNNLQDRENFWICNLKSFDPTIGYNSLNCSSANTGKSHKKSTIKKLSKINSKRNNPMFGKKHSLKSRKSISKANKGQLIGNKNPMYGKTHSNSIKKFLSEINKGKVSSSRKKVKQLDKNTNEVIKIWDSLSSAAKFFGNIKYVSKISDVCHKYVYNGYSRKTALGYKWEFV